MRNSTASTLTISGPDRLALLLLLSDQLVVDHTGAIFRNGKRAEVLDKRTGYGRVMVQRQPKLVWAMAHRVVWMAMFGPIPPNLVINHKNKRRWDNRPTNLDLTDARGNAHHAQNREYPRIGVGVGDISPDWIGQWTKGEPLAEETPLLRRAMYHTAA